MAEARYDAVADFYTAAFDTHRRPSLRGLWLDELAEPAPEPQWTEKGPDASRVPVYLAGRCLKEAR